MTQSLVRKNRLDKLRPEDRSRLEQKHKSLKFSLTPAQIGRGSEAQENMPHLLQYKDDIERKINKIGHQIEADASLEAKGRTRAVLSKRKKEIEVLLRVHLPSLSEANRTMKSSGPADFERAVQKTIKMVEMFGKLVTEWKQIMNRLEPEDPTADDIYNISRRRI